MTEKPSVCLHYSVEITMFPYPPCLVRETPVPTHSETQCYPIAIKSGREIHNVLSQCSLSVCSVFLLSLWLSLTWTVLLEESMPRMPSPVATSTPMPRVDWSSWITVLWYREEVTRDQVHASMWVWKGSFLSIRQTIHVLTRQDTRFGIQCNN